MAKRDEVSAKRKAKCRVQGRLCLACTLVFFPKYKLQEYCLSCERAVLNGMSEIKRQGIDR